MTVVEFHYRQLCQNKAIDAVSWCPARPEISLADLLDSGPTNLIVLEPSRDILAKAKGLLAIERVSQVHRIEAEVTPFESSRRSTLWHDHSCKFLHSMVLSGAADWMLSAMTPLR